MGSPGVQLSVLMFVVMVSCVVHGQPLVPGFSIFGDSICDVGNNNNRTTLLKANFPPYGRDFVTHSPTGRWCNGKLAADFTAENLGFTSYPPAYFSPEAEGQNLLIGANFASAGSGYYDVTARLYNAIPLTEQLNHYRDYQTKLAKIVGPSQAQTIINGSIYLLSAGSSDFLQNYYINPIIHNTYSPDHNQCVPRLNRDAVAFNNKLNATAQSLKTRLPDVKIVVFDIYQPLLDLITKPSDNGFFEARRACCGTGTFETSLLCNTKSIGTCANATQYVFWDGFHPSESANKILADDLLLQGIDLIS
ncbi:hypothetical protein Scep_015380 [Stephania cephalantha]|uniref:GDSL esterase/lipase n=1 Tax=Stephania cephalantha TaxID=152367 RepID=A0AAP0P1E6_9MAGN